MRLSYMQWYAYVGNMFIVTFGEKAFRKLSAVVSEGDAHCIREQLLAILQEE